MRGKTVLPGIEMLYLQDDGTEVWTRVASVPITAADGHVTGAFAVVTDIDALKRAAEPLREGEDEVDSEPCPLGGRILKA